MGVTPGNLHLATMVLRLEPETKSGGKTPVRQEGLPRCVHPFQPEPEGGGSLPAHPYGQTGMAGMHILRKTRKDQSLLPERSRFLRSLGSR